MYKRHITREGFKELQNRLQELRSQRTMIAHEMREMASQGGALTSVEDSTSMLQRSKIAELDSQIQEIEHTIATAKVIRRPVSCDEVRLGSRVTLAISGVARAYTIVGSVEADPDAGKVSDESPLGRSLLGKCAGQDCEIGPRKLVATIMTIE